jgi:EamA domain-containing membrane protein RarD
MISATEFDFISLILWIAFPIYLIFRSRRPILAIIGAALFVWLFGIFTGFMLAALDPERRNAIGDGAWIVVGPIAGVLYATLLYLIKWAGCRIWGRMRAGRDGSQGPPI